MTEIFLLKKFYEVLKGFFILCRNPFYEIFASTEFFHFLHVLHFRAELLRRPPSAGFGVHGNCHLLGDQEQISHDGHRHSHADEQLFIRPGKR